MQHVITVLLSEACVIHDYIKMCMELFVHTCNIITVLVSVVCYA